jgi:hypothetical protein
MKLLIYDNENEKSVVFGLEENGNIHVKVGDEMAEVNMKDWMKVSAFIRVEEETRAEERRKKLSVFKRMFSL